ncbi:MAG TPA: alcohol dehydrogenase catalytic domain-containing protein [Chloroflexota bacterium]|nr:alcohol dehydrogenase catalytic domain-containing protein [Chloroflexota bacterium]
MQSQQIPEMMRAAVLVDPSDLKVMQRPVPKPGPQQVLIKVAACAICGTDLKITSHPFPGQPPFGEFIPGHEYVGTVVALGDTVDEFKIGDRVAVEAHKGCMRCENCIKGEYTACLNYGNIAKGHHTSGFTVPGGFAEYVVHHINAVYKIPDEISFEEATMVTTTGTPLYGLDVAGGFIAGDSIAVIGPGPIGLTTSAICKVLCADPVILVGTNEARMELGHLFGADKLVRARGDEAVKQVRGLTDGIGVDMTIDCAGGPGTLNDAIRMTKLGGKVLLLAFYKEDVTADISTAIRSDITIYTTRGEGHAACKRGMSMMKQGKLPMKRMVTHEFKLEDIMEGFATFRERRDNAIKVLVKP